jgi:hypothetical protein
LHWPSHSSRPHRSRRNRLALAILRRLHRHRWRHRTVALTAGASARLAFPSLAAATAPQLARSNNNITRTTSTSPSPCMHLASASGTAPRSAARSVTAFLWQNFTASQRQLQSQSRSHLAATQQRRSFSTLLTLALCPQPALYSALCEGGTSNVSSAAAATVIAPKLCFACPVRLAVTSSGNASPSASAATLNTCTQQLSAWTQALVFALIRVTLSARCQTRGKLSLAFDFANTPTTCSHLPPLQSAMFEMRCLPCSARQCFALFASFSAF